MDATTVTVDLAKDIFEVAVANRAGRILERKRLTRRPFERFVDGLPAGTEVIIEACGTAHYWARSRISSDTNSAPSGATIHGMQVSHRRTHVRMPE